MLQRVTIRPMRAVLLAGAICLLSGWGVPHAAAQTAARTAARTYFIAENEGVTGSRASDRQLTVWALEAWQRQVPTLRFEPAKETDALIRLYWTASERGRSGLYG